MSKLHQDQAAGLRRIMAAPAPRVISIISAADTQDQARLMTNLAASISNQDMKTLIVHASKQSSETIYGIHALPTLLEVSKNKSLFQQAIHMSHHGFSVAKLMQKSQLSQTLDPMSQQAIDGLFHQLVQQYEVLLVDATLSDNNVLPLQLLNQGEILIQLTRKAESIKDAYTLIKRMYSELGRRSFGIIVDDANDAQAQVVFKNISEVAKRFLRIELEFFGAIPNDVHLSKATQLGRSVIEAFPLASASTAFKKMAQKFDYRRATPSNTHQASFV